MRSGVCDPVEYTWTGGCGRIVFDLREMTEMRVSPLLLLHPRRSFFDLEEFAAAAVLLPLFFARFFTDSDRRPAIEGRLGLKQRSFQ